MPESRKIKKALNNLLNSPGIYKIIDKERKVIYIGKAKNINKRVKQYFQKNYQHSTRTQKLIENIADIESISVDSELEAMILETNLIKQFQPKYNILMKDDKNYVYIKITKEDFPRIQIVRKIEKDKSKYIGPKTAAYKVKDTFKFLKKIFPFRHCGLDLKYKNGEVKVSHKVIKYPCLDYYIKRCAGPCVGKCTPEEYSKIIKNVVNFLEGKGKEILKELKEEMTKYAQSKKFEKAAKIRDKIQKIISILEKQKVADPAQEDTDIINYCITQGKAYFNLFQIRDGKLIGQENFILTAKDIEESENSEVLDAFIKQYYCLALDSPKEILIPHEIENIKETEKFLEKQFNKKIKILLPQRGTKNKLLEMSLNNARIFADRNKPSWQEESEITKKAAEELQKLLKIKEPLKRIECYDISHLSGTNTVGSMIVFEKGIPKNQMYRKFQIRTVIGKPDDYKSMEEVLLRRFSKISQEIQHKDYKFKKAGKKDKEFIEKNNKVKLNEGKRQFYILEKNKKQVGFISISKHSDKVSELRNLWILKSERGKKLGYKILKSAISKAKSKRVYGICKKELQDYYALLGFEEIKKVPEELEKRYKYLIKKFGKAIPMVYDKNKHKPDKSFSQIPDLVIVDGGKGQLGVAEKVFNELNLQIPHVALAKQLEEIHCPVLTNPLILQSNNDALKLLQRARDEAHRFAISYNKNLRAKKFS